MKIAILPARGGSKRVPRKNIKIFSGKPMIYWSITAALESKCFDEIIVSTDDKEIAEIARMSGAEVPFIRPNSLSDDYTETLPVIRHALEFFKSNGSSVSHACCVYPTAPFITPTAIKNALKLLEEPDAEFSFPATTFGHPIERAFTIGKNKFLEAVPASSLSRRTQDLTEYYHDAGQFYWGTHDAWLERDSIIGPNSVILPLPRHQCIDVDTHEDWHLAERLFYAKRFFPD